MGTWEWSRRIGRAPGPRILQFGPDSLDFGVAIGRDRLEVPPQFRVPLGELRRVEDRKHRRLVRNQALGHPGPGRRFQPRRSPRAGRGSGPLPGPSSTSFFLSFSIASSNTLVGGWGHGCLLYGSMLTPFRGGEGDMAWALFTRTACGRVHSCRAARGNVARRKCPRLPAFPAARSSVRSVSSRDAEQHGVERLRSDERHGESDRPGRRP